MQSGYPLDELVEQLTKLPGIGVKAAQRLAFFFLSMPTQKVNQFCEVLKNTRSKIAFCKTCFNISFESICHICADESRQKDALCIVAEPKDIISIEKSLEFKGVYHVLGGLISPLDGLHPEALRISELLERLTQSSFSEVILAINPTVEGDATILYIMSLLKQKNIPIYKLAYGLPIGSQIDYADEVTLKKAFQGRVQLSL